MTDINTMEETNQCDKCVHRYICKFKEELINVTKQLKETQVEVTNILGERIFIKLYDIPYIRPIKLICKHCMMPPSNTLLRKTD